MEITSRIILLRVLIVIWSLTIGRSLLIMLGGKLFEKAAKGKKTALYPIINLFTMLEIVDMSTFYGILFFIPVLNLIVLVMMSYKLGNVFNCSLPYKIGLILLPIVFYPMLFYSDKPYKVSDEEYFKALNDARGESINLMTDEEIKAEESNIEEEEIKVDSIFKSDISLEKEPEKYRAVKIDLLSPNPINNDNEMEMEDLLKPQNDITNNKPNNVQNTTIEKLEILDNTNNTQLVNNEKPKDNMEIIDL